MATDYSTQITGQWTCFEEQIDAAIAILDCAAAVQAEGDLKTGYRVMHESLPNVLKHVLGSCKGLTRCRCAARDGAEQDRGAGRRSIMNKTG
jgi:hypothetical protein